MVGRSWTALLLLCTATVVAVVVVFGTSRATSLPNNTLIQRALSLRRRDNQDIFCLIERAELRWQDSTAEVKYLCTPVLNNVLSSSSYEIVLPGAIQAAFAAQTSQDFHISLAQAYIDEPSASIITNSQTQMTIVNVPVRRRKMMTSAKGSYKALIVRVTLLDTASMYSSNQLYQLHFQDPVGFKNQYYQCSFGKLRIEPAGEGVIDVTVNAYSSTAQQTVVNMAQTAALAYVNGQGGTSYTSIFAYTDMILFVLPDMGSWLAYGTVGGGTTVFNGRWGGYVASLMHETGHNFGLMHAWQGGQEYKDYTGYMSGALIGYHDRTGSPSMCYNAPDHWKLGWYSDRSIKVNIYTSTLVRLAAFADYDKASAGEYVIIRSGNVYMHYNRAKGVNINTGAYKDYLTIYQDNSYGTALFAALSYPGNTVYEQSFSAGTWHAEICDSIMGNSYTADTLVVSVGFGTSQCANYKMSSVNVGNLGTYSSLGSLVPGGGTRRLQDSAWDFPDMRNFTNLDKP